MRIFVPSGSCASSSAVILNRSLPLLDVNNEGWQISTPGALEVTAELLAEFGWQIPDPAAIRAEVIAQAAAECDLEADVLRDEEGADTARYLAKPIRSLAPSYLVVLRLERLEELREAVAVSLWQEELGSTAPSVRARRTLEAFRDQSDETRAKFQRLMDSARDDVLRQIH